MGSWSYVYGGKGFISDESISTPDAIARGENGFMGSELKTRSNYGSKMVCSSQDTTQNQGFVELGFPERTKKSFSRDSIRNVLSTPGSSKVGDARMFNPVIASTNAFSWEEESSSKISSSIVESNCRESSFIDLKLGRFGDHRDAHNLHSIKATPNLSSAESSIPANRLRTGSLSSSITFCQVHGCKKDLSSSKDYHKRHKVCEVHSKTAKVIVNGIAQRFCQQCSRFHLLAEFDDGKRSCRKRLAGHNERRRKPHVDIHSGRTGCRFQGTTFMTSSFLGQNILSSSVPHIQKYEMNDWSRHIKLEDRADYSHQSAIPSTKGLLHQKSLLFSSESLLFSSDLENQCPHLHNVDVATARGSKFNENSNAVPNFVLRSFFQNASIVCEDFAGFDSAPIIQGLSGISNSGCAPSLLSSQSQNSSSQSSGIPMAYPLVMTNGNGHHSVTQVSEKVRVSPKDSLSGRSHKFHSPGVNSAEETHLDPILISDNSDDVNFGINRIFQGSEYIKSKDTISCEDAPTINLPQLSSQLERVEHQNESMQVTQGNGAFCGLRIT